MNLIQQADVAKNLSDQQLQKELLNPSGSLPSFLALSELQRRKEMRANYAAMQQKPTTSMAEDFTRGLGGAADVGRYPEAIRASSNGYADGGEVSPWLPSRSRQEAPYGSSGDIIWRYLTNPGTTVQGGTPIPEPAPVPPVKVPPMGVVGPLYPRGRSMWNADPDTTLGETWARQFHGRTLDQQVPSPEIPPPISTKDFLPPAPATASGGGQGYGGPEPMDIGSVPAPAGSGPGGAPEAPQGTSQQEGAAASQPGGGLSSALNSTSLADYVNQIKGLREPDRFGSMEAANAADRQRLLHDLENDKGMALLAAGLGIMGGTSPFAATNIGQGAMAGIKYWADSKRQQYEAERAIRSAETQIAVAKANQDERALDNGVKTWTSAQEAYQRSQDRLAIAKQNLDARREYNDIREYGTLTSQANSLGAQINNIRTALGNITLDPDLKKQYLQQLPGLQQQYQSVLEQLNNQRGQRRGGAPASSQNAQPANAPVTLTSRKQYEDLPSGAQYIDTDGQVRVKK